MKNTNSAQRLDCDLNTSWVIHIYDKNRRLRCTLEPSHGWSFLSGTIVGLLVAIVGFNLAPHTPIQSTEPSAPKTAPLQLD